MGSPYLLAALVVLGTLLSGCAGGNATPAASTEPTSVVIAGEGEVPDAATLNVAVVDDSVQPVAGADVAIFELQVSATTDALGAATFTNVPPGTYTVAAQKLGYESAARRVDVAPDDTASATLHLVPIAIDEPRIELKGPFQGYFDCRFGNAAQTGACVPLAAANSNDKAQFYFKMEEDTQAFMAEMTWSQGSFATSQQLRMSFSHQNRTSTHWFCTATSGSPIRWTYDMEDGCNSKAYCGVAPTQGTSGSQPAEPDPKLNLMVYVNTPFSCPNAAAPVPDANNLHPAELALQQKFTIYVTLFHGMDAPEGYTALPDA